MGQRVALVDWHSVRNTITRIHNDARSATRGVQRKHRLDGDVHGRHVECLEHDLGHALAISLRVEWRLSQKHRVLLWRDTQLVVESVMPDLLHVIPVRDDAVLDWVLESKHTALALR